MQTHFRVVTAMLPHVFAEGTLCHIGFASNAMKGACCTSVVADYGGNRAADGLGMTLPAAKLCCAIRHFQLLQGVPLKLLVAVLIVAVIANITLRILG